MRIVNGKRYASGDDHYRWNHGAITSSDGYRLVRVGRDHPLSDPNGYAYEHVLVWVSAGNPRPGPGEIIHHLSGSKTDNRITNMRLVSVEEHNAIHGRTKLTEAIVVEIRNLYASGNSMGKIAERYGVAMGTVSKIVKGKKWRKAGGPLSPIDNRRRGPDGTFVGKRSAGRLLDGREWIGDLRA